VVPTAVLLAPLLLAAALDRGAPQDLSGPWRFHVGDRAQWAGPAFDDASWPVVHLPTGWGRSTPEGVMAWYRRSVRVDPEAVRTPPGLAVLIGNVDSAYEIYAGGRRLGGVGALPPDPRIDYDRHGLYVLPPEAVGEDGRVVIALRVWKSPQTESSVGGPVEGPLRLGPTLELEREATRLDMVRLLLGGLFVLVGLYHLHVFRRRTRQREYLWYAAIAVAAGLYTLLRTQSKYALTDRFVPLKELEYAVMLILPALFIQFLWPLLGHRLTLPLRAFQAWTVGLALLVSLTPGLWLNTHALPLWEGSLALLVAATLVLLAREAWRGHPEARTLAAGLGAFFVFALHDVALDRGLVSTPRLVPFGFGVFVIAMAISLSNRFGRLQAELATLHRELERRVEERTAELARRTAEASAASRTKSRFLATISHEIRTPLNAVIGMTDEVLRSPLGAEQRESLEVVRRSGEGLLDLLNDVLDFSRAESDRLVLESQPFSPRSCMEDALDMMAARAAEKGLDLAYVAAPDVPSSVLGDARRVRQVLVNLLGNAVKFTSSGGVLARVERWPAEDGRDGLHVSVADTGMGIPRDRRGQLFEAFGQLDASHSRQHGGTGLGLAISRRLCDLMGGRLWLGDDPGPGCVFHFAFPAAAVGPEHAEPRRDSALHGRTALVVSARSFTRHALEACLVEWRMGAEVVGSIEEAEERLRRGGVDVVLLGLGPGGCGPDAATRLGRHGAGGKPPFVGLGPLPASHRGPAVSTLAARIPVPIRPALLQTALLEVFGERVSSSAAPEASAPGAPGGARPLRILLAEDNRVNQRVVLGLLRHVGYSAEVAANGLEVLEALRRKTFDVVLLDVQMPELDGLETARRIRREWNPGPWLVAVTASALHGDREACLEAGMDDYLAKPFRSRALAAALARCPAADDTRPEDPGGSGPSPVGPHDRIEPLLTEGDGCVASTPAPSPRATPSR